MSETLTPVIFRKFNDGDVIALFPAEAGDMDAHLTCSSYMHVGQHGAAGLSIIQSTKAATPEEYAALKRELESAPYDYKLKVYRRMQRRWLKDRRAQVRT